MPDYQIDLGIGDVGEGLEDISARLRKKTMQDEKGRLIEREAGGLTSSDPVITQMLRAANQQKDPEVARKLLDAVYKRAGELVDVSAERRYSEPERNIRIQKGQLDIDKIIKDKERRQSEKAFLADNLIDHTQLKGDRLREHLLNTAYGVSEARDDADPYLKALTSNARGEDMRARAARASTDKQFTQEFTSLRAEARSYNVANNRLISEISKLKKGYDFKLPEEKLIVDAEVEKIKDEIRANTSKLDGVLERELELYARFRPKSNWHRQREKIIQNIIKASKMPNGEEIIRRASENLRRRGKSFESYRVPYTILPKKKPGEKPPMPADFSSAGIRR